MTAGRCARSRRTSWRSAAGKSSTTAGTSDERHRPRGGTLRATPDFGGYAMFRLLVLLPLMVGPPGYKHVGGRNGVEVFRQMSSPAIDLYAEGDIEAPPWAVRAALLDYDHAS